MNTWAKFGAAVIGSWMLMGCGVAVDDAADSGNAADAGVHTPDAGKPLSWTERVRNGETLNATLETSKGTMVMELYSKKAPKTVENFVGLATGEKTWTDPDTGEDTNRKLYDGTIFHRVIPDFMIQGGDPLGTGRGGPGYKFDDENSGYKFDKGCIVAMANAGPNTNGSQFFITETETPWLDGKYNIFGFVTSGCEIEKVIARVPRDGNDRPLEDVVLQKVTISLPE